MFLCDTLYNKRLMSPLLQGKLHMIYRTSVFCRVCLHGKAEVWLSPSVCHTNSKFEAQKATRVCHGCPVSKDVKGTRVMGSTALHVV